jgi:hypothetical protein
MKILLLTGHFPPEQSGGVGRPYSLYKYLPDHGIRVSVITKNLHGILPNEKNIYRYDSFGSWRNSPWLSKKVLFKIISLLKNKIYGVNYDGWWVKEVLKHVNDYNKLKDIDLIYASFPGPEVLEAALKLKANLQIPLITEFRDGLAFEPVVNNPNFFQKIIMSRLEKRIINVSNAIVTIGQRLSDYFIQTYKRKVFTIYNGYEESDLESSVNYETKNKTKKYIVHFGSLSASRKTVRDGLFKSLKYLKSRKIIYQDNFGLLFIGNISNHEKKEIATYDLNDVITFLPQMDKKEGFSFITKHADYLLLYGLPNKTTIISSKLPEYIKLNKPIIGICKGNEAELIIQRTGTGEVCDFDENSIEPLLMKALNREIYYEPDYTEIAKFNRRYQAREIAQIIKDVHAASKD